MELQPSACVRAVADEILNFKMPGAGIPRFNRKAALIAKAGIYNTRVHRDEVVLPILKYWKFFELTGLDQSAEQARARVRAHLDELEVSARQLEVRLARSSHPQ
jgi:acyl-[acyl-carrier-protein] desaturase